MPELRNVLKFLDIVGNYYTLQLGRGAVFSALLMILALILRRISKNTVFLKGLWWSLLLLAPFMGRLRIFYENERCVRLTGWWIAWCMGELWVSRVYFLGMAAAAFLLIRRRARLNRFVKGMDRSRIAGTDIFVCGLPVTPFATGLLFPGIAVPEVMLKAYREEELSEILLHEKTHIRLGHLWLYLIWDMLHVLFWINPLFVSCFRYLKEDLEDICDRVTIRKSGRSGYEYGRLLLDSVKLLQKETIPCGVKPPFAFAGEKEYLQIKRRIKRVVGCKGYNRCGVLGMTGIAALTLAVLLIGIYERSYARYQDFDEISLYDMTGKTVLLEDNSGLREVISIDENCLRVDTKGLEDLLKERNLSKPEYVLSFGGYFKLPGYGGGFGYAIIEQDQLKGGVEEIPYYTASDWYTWLFKRI